MEKKQFNIEIKQESITDNGMFSGLASTFGGEPDSYGDVVMHGAFSESLQSGGRNKRGIAMLYQHDSSKPIGRWEKLQEIETGLYVEGRLNLEKQICKDIFSDLKFGSIGGMSIGFNCQEDDMEVKNGIRYLKKINLWEISLVTFPANVNATVSLVKSIQNAQTVRDLEAILRDANIPISAAKYIANQMKGSRDDAESLKSILDGLRQITKQ